MRTFVTSRIARIVVLSIVVTGVTSLIAHAELKPITTVEGITEYRLDNGLQVLLFPDSSKPTA